MAIKKTQSQLMIDKQERSRKKPRNKATGKATKSRASNPPTTKTNPDERRPSTMKPTTKATTSDSKVTPAASAKTAAPPTREALRKATTTQAKAKKEGFYEQKRLNDQAEGEEGKYGENKYAGNNAVYQLKNGLDEQSLLGHQESSKFYKHHPFIVPFHHY
ncbi:hypothetical protein NQ317_014744 [Molorchus minor]|uniref:Uncharacterized protein n=1 Tax=Molorchus minor TaxID=1323400 RepID=A0ABQ9J562_9CUCU|nr:hypothetical protein NQ317_014744 [Molorchus minor]